MKISASEACLAATYAFYAGLDRFEKDQVLAVVSSDAQWTRQQKVHQGIQAISAILDSRPTHMKTAHVVCNPTVEQLTEETAVVRYFLLIAASDANLPAPAGKLFSVRDGQNDLKIEDGEWKISRIATELCFDFAG